MAEVLELETDEIDKLLDKYGLNQFWRNVLYTSILNHGERFAYITADPNFSNAVELQKDYIKGLSIGEVSVLYEYTLAYDNVEQRKERGQFFTPDDISSRMAGFSNGFPDTVWLDPCSGVGNLSWHLTNQQDSSEKFLINNLKLSDIDDLALLVARTILTLSFQKNEGNLFNLIENNFIFFDFLSAHDNGGRDLLSVNNLDTIPEHDYVIVNPPYLAVERNDDFECSESRDLYAYFLENVAKTSSGFISITPQSYTNSRKFGKLREILLRETNSAHIYNFDNKPQSVFSGVKFGSSNNNKSNSVRASIIVSNPKFEGNKITPMLRWRASSRAKMVKELDYHLSDASLGVECFPKVSKSLVKFYNEVIGNDSLRTIVSDKQTDYVLYIPSSPRYFISALKSPVSRSSIKTLFFDNKENLNKAYLMLNSSLLYWWWRVRDWGMTLSTETLLSLPIVDIRNDEGLVRLLEESEEENKVYKMNAGKMQENVKHPISLLRKLNDFVVPEYAEQLLAVHRNDDFVLD